VECILTRDEIKELIAAVRHGDIEVDAETPSAKAERPVVGFDLMRSQGGGSRRLPNIDLILDAFSQNYALSLGKRLQRSALVKRTAIETQSYEQLLSNQAGWGSIGVIRLDPLRWGGLVIYDKDLSFFLVESLLGGGGEDRLVVPDRALTAIERHVVKPVFADVCPDLAKAFRSVVDLHAALAKVESNIRLVNIFPADAMLMVVCYTVTVGALSGQMMLVIPYASLEPLLDKLRGGAAFSLNRDDLWRPHMEAELEQMEASLVVQLGMVNLKVRDILNFQLGDILDLGTDPAAPLRVVVEGRGKFFSQAGVRNGRKSVRIIGEIKQRS
jgi:flagellar motor switch protein FliM